MNVPAEPTGTYVYIIDQEARAKAGGSVLQGLWRPKEQQKLRSDSLLGTGNHKDGQGTLLTTTSNLGAKKSDPGQQSQCRVTN